LCSQGERGAQRRGRAPQHRAGIGEAIELAKKSLLDREVLRSVLLDVEGAAQRRFEVLDRLDALDRFGRVGDQLALGEVAEIDADRLERRGHDQRIGIVERDLASGAREDDGPGAPD